MKAVNLSTPWMKVSLIRANEKCRIARQPGNQVNIIEPHLKRTSASYVEVVNNGWLIQAHGFWKTSLYRLININLGIRNRFDSVLNMLRSRFNARDNDKGVSDVVDRVCNSIRRPVILRKRFNGKLEPQRAH